jgi:hypothetical protein
MLFCPEGYFSMYEVHSLKGEFGTPTRTMKPKERVNRSETDGRSGNQLGGMRDDSRTHTKEASTQVLEQNKNHHAPVLNELMSYVGIVWYSIYFYVYSGAPPSLPASIP